MEFQILDRKRYPLEPREEVVLLPYYKYEHRATLGWGTREFIILVDHGLQNENAKVHIEEVVGGHLESISDDSLHAALSKFALENGFLQMSVPFPRKLYY